MENNTSELESLHSFLEIPFDGQLYSVMLDEKESLQTSSESNLQIWLDLLQKKIVKDVLYNREMIEK